MSNDQPSHQEKHVSDSSTRMTSEQVPTDSQPMEAKLISRGPSISQEPRIESPALQTAVPNHSNEQILQNKWVVLGILFFVMGFLGIPLLWSNKKFSPTERIVWAVVVSIYTLVLIAIAAGVCYWSYRQIMG